MSASAASAVPATAAPAVAARIAAIDWPQVAIDLDAEGHALIPGLLNAFECETLAALYASGDAQKPPLFRSRVVMARHGFGRGEYKYFSYPLPALIARLRSALYPRLAPLANRWHAAMGLDARFPPDHEAFIARCHQAGQRRPTPLLLQYGEGDYNCLHQDLYGEQVFPLQAVLLLSRPGHDFEGGELVLTEQRPRMQSRPMVLPMQQGDMALIAVHQRPVKGVRGFYRVQLRHGVSRIRGGKRHTAGIIFHDAT